MVDSSSSPMRVNMATLIALFALQAQVQAYVQDPLPGAPVNPSLLTCNDKWTGRLDKPTCEGHNDDPFQTLKACCKYSRQCDNLSKCSSRFCCKQDGSARYFTKSQLVPSPTPTPPAQHIQSQTASASSVCDSSRLAGERQAEIQWKMARKYASGCESLETAHQQLSGHANTRNTCVGHGFEQKLQALYDQETAACQSTKPVQTPTPSVVPEVQTSKNPMVLVNALGVSLKKDISGALGWWTSDVPSAQFKPLVDGVGVLQTTDTDQCLQIQTDPDTNESWAALGDCEYATRFEYNSKRRVYHPEGRNKLCLGEIESMLSVGSKCTYKIEAVDTADYVEVEITPPSEQQYLKTYTVNVDVGPGVSAEVEQGCMAAAQRLMEIVHIKNDHDFPSSSTVESNTNPKCNIVSPMSAGTELPDGLKIMLRSNAELPSRTYARTRTCMLDNGTPRIGMVVFNPNKRPESYETVCLHEILHAMGVSNSGKMSGMLKFVPGTTSWDYMDQGRKVVSDARCAYCLGGGKENDDKYMFRVNSQGHLNEEEFGEELMTPYSRTGGVGPLSAVTLGILSDLGYGIKDYNKADKFLLGPARTSTECSKMCKGSALADLEVSEHGFKKAKAGSAAYSKE